MHKCILCWSEDNCHNMAIVIWIKYVEPSYRKPKVGWMGDATSAFTLKTAKNKNGSARGYK